MSQTNSSFQHWDTVRDIIDQTIDLMINYRQSGHPGGSRSKVPLFVALALSGAMRWDVRDPLRRYADRFILGGGHAVPLAYAGLATLNEAMRIRRRQTGDPKFSPANPALTLYWEDLLAFRRNRGLSGHAEMEGKTLFLKFNTGPSGHGCAAAVGVALALKMARAKGVKVFVMEGEGGLTPGVNLEVRNAAWGYGLDNLFFLVDWNDFGIDGHRVSSVVPGTPAEWFRAASFRVVGAEDGEDWEQLARGLAALVGEAGESPGPAMMWARTRKGRGYLKYDAASHGAPHSPANSPTFWETKRPFAEKYGIEFDGFGRPAPASDEELRKQTATNLERVMGVLAQDQELCTWLSDRLVELAGTVPDAIEGIRFEDGRNPWLDPRLFDETSYPESLWARPGEKQANKAALGRWGAYVNALAKKNYGRPMFVAMSADLAESTNVAGFAQDFSQDLTGFGKYERAGNPDGVLLPSVITEFLNSGICAGLASVNLSRRPFDEWDGLAGVCSTYGSFVYLKYGMFRLFSQMQQDCQVRLGKVLWVVGHSGPETAEDSRTHFGIFSPACTQLFPKGKVINCHPWEHNEVPVVLAAAFRQAAPIVALHLTRPPIEIPDRQALGLPSRFEAAKGAYLLRDFKPGTPRHGTVIVQGTMTTRNVLSLLPALDTEGWNVKLIAAVSPELFNLQPAEYRERVLPWNDFLDSTFITNQAKVGMQDWCSGPLSLEYAMSADWDDRWRTGGSIEELYDEAHLSPRWLLAGIRRFARERATRLARLRIE
jgi:transketolase